MVGTIKKTINGLFRQFGYNVKKISKEKEYTNLDEYFSKWPNGELFMQYIYSIIVKKGDCVIDVGANHEIHTVPLSELVGGYGTVIACEAVLHNINDIKSKLITDNVSFYCVALTKPDIAKEKPEISFYYFPSGDGFSGIKRRPDVKSAENIITVQTDTLDKIAERINLKSDTKITFIKTDVEGGDFDVLLGAEGILKKYKPVVVFENLREFSAKLYNYTKEEFFYYFNDLGYKLFKFSGEKFSETDWYTRGVYCETWMVHKESEHINFFEKNYSNFAFMCMTQKKYAYRTKGVIV